MPARLTRVGSRVRSRPPAGTPERARRPDPRAARLAERSLPMRVHGFTPSALGGILVCFRKTIERSVMVEVVLSENDRLDWALKKFRRKMLRSGRFKDMKKKRYYEKPSEARKRKAAAARRRNARARRRRNR